MSNISYFRAGLACLPFIGPYIELNMDFCDEMFDGGTESSKALKEFNQRFSAANSSNNLECFKQIKGDLTNHYIPIIQRQRTYHICGLVGAILSIATLVRMVALKILAPEARSLTIGYIAVAAFDSFLVYQDTKDIRNLREINARF